MHRVPCCFFFFSFSTLNILVYWLLRNLLRIPNMWQFTSLACCFQDSFIKFNYVCQCGFLNSSTWKLLSSLMFICMTFIRFEQLSALYFLKYSVPFSLPQGLLQSIALKWVLKLGTLSHPVCFSQNCASYSGSFIFQINLFGNINKIEFLNGKELSF